MESQAIQPEYVAKLIGELGYLKADCLYKDMIIQQLQEKAQAMGQALEEAHTKLEALSEVDTYLVDDEEVDKSFVCE